MVLSRKLIRQMIIETIREGDQEKKMPKVSVKSGDEAGGIEVEYRPGNMPEPTGSGEQFSNWQEAVMRAFEEIDELKAKIAQLSR